MPSDPFRPPTSAPHPPGAGARLPALSEVIPGTIRTVLDAAVARAIVGVGPLRGAASVADEHLADAVDVEEAVRRFVATHVRLAGVSGFVTGLGGVAALPISLPAGVSGLYVIAARMTAGIAHLRGYDVRSEEVRSAVAVCLIGSAGAEAVKRAGVRATRTFLTASLRRMSVGKAIPLIGGPIGGAVDAAACRGIARYALKVFARRNGGIALTPPFLVV